MTIILLSNKVSISWLPRFPESACFRYNIAFNFPPILPKSFTNSVYRYSLVCGSLRLTHSSTGLYWQITAENSGHPLVNTLPLNLSQFELWIAARISMIMTIHGHKIIIIINIIHQPHLTTLKDNINLIPPSRYHAESLAIWNLYSTISWICTSYWNFDLL